MSYLIAYRQRAIAEYEAAALWYKERSVQAPENFETADQVSCRHKTSTRFYNNPT